MWIIIIKNDPGSDYGQFQVGHFMPIGGDHLFMLLQAFPATREGASDSMALVHYLNGGMSDHQCNTIQRILEGIESRIGEIGQVIEGR
jgi:hypothetical protein